MHLFVFELARPRLWSIFAPGSAPPNRCVAFILRRAWWEKRLFARSSFSFHIYLSGISWGNNVCRHKRSFFPPLRWPVACIGSRPLPLFPRFYCPHISMTASFAFWSLRSPLSYARFSFLGRCLMTPFNRGLLSSRNLSSLVFVGLQADTSPFVGIH